MSIDFDGVDDDISFGSDASTDDQYPFTIGAWIFPRTNGEGSGGVILSKVNAPVGSGFRFYITSSRLAFFMNHTTANLLFQSADNSITLNDWNHVAVTYTGGNTQSAVIFYVNGISTSFFSQTTGRGTRASDASNRLMLGNADTPSVTFDGVISDVFFYGSGIFQPYQIQNIASSRIRYVPLMHMAETGGFVGYWPLDDIVDGAVITGSGVIRNRANANNNGSPASTPTSSINDILTYP